VAPTVGITVVTAQEKILPVLRPAIAADAEGLLGKVGVTVIKNARVKAVSPESAGTDDVAAKATITLEDGKTLEADLYIPAMGTTPNTSFLAKEFLASDGRVQVNRSTLRVETTSGQRIYAIGDVSSAARPAVHNVFAAVPVLCANIKKDLLSAVGSKHAEGMKDREFKEDTRETQMVPIGRGKGVGAVMGFRLPSFMVWVIKGRDYWLWSLGNMWSGKQWAKES
jgi:NADH dehydrogenase FAD-containing subunit